ncbi:MAG: tetratricopeptide repeat protein [bacterium]|nr:tetratricopeptide repeat protein [bacterium]
MILRDLAANVRHHRALPILLGGLLLGATAVAYLGALRNDFCLDDTGMVVDNRYVAASAWGELWTTSYWQGVTGTTGGLYRPLTLTLITLERELFGETAAAYHLVSILLQALAGCCLVWAARRTGSPAGVSVLAGLMLCVHPAASEVVNTVVGAADLLGFVWGLAGVTILLTCRNTPMMMLACVMLIGAALYKESAAVFAVGAIVTLLCHDRRHPPLLAAVAALLIPILLRVGLTGHLDPGSIGFLDNPLAFSSLITRWLNAPTLAVRYLLLVVFPWPLAADYSYDAIPIIPVHDVAAWLPPLLICVSLGVLLWSVVRRHRLPVLWIGLSVTMLALATHMLVPVGTIYAERLAYPVLAASCVAVAASMQRLRRYHGPGIALCVVAIWLLLFASLARTRTRDWQDDGTLFASALRVQTGSARVHYGWARWQQRQGNLLESLKAYQEALQIYPRYADALLNQGAVLLQLGRHTEALGSYQAATQARPGDVQGLFAVAAIKEVLGVEGATAAYQEVLRLRPQHAEAARGAARCLVAAGDSLSARMVVQQVFAEAASSEWRRLFPGGSTAGRAGVGEP